MVQAEQSLPYFHEGSEAMLQLEAMVDRAGLGNVFYALAHICHAKADHIQANWQDPITAKWWERLRNAIHTAAQAMSAAPVIRKETRNRTLAPHKERNLRKIRQ